MKINRGVTGSSAIAKECWHGFRVGSGTVARIACHGASLIGSAVYDRVADRMSERATTEMGADRLDGFDPITQPWMGSDGPIAYEKFWSKRYIARPPPYYLRT